MSVGRFRLIAVTPPAAGAQVSQIVPAGFRWRLISFICTLVTDATVINRRVQLILDANAAGTFYWAPLSTVVQSASETRGYTWGRVGAVEDVNNEYMGQLPEHLIMRPGDRIRTATAGMQAADDFSGGAINLYIEEW